MKRYFTIQLFGQLRGAVLAENERQALLKVIAGIKVKDLHTEDLDPRNAKDAGILTTIQELEAETVLGTPAERARVALIRGMAPGTVH